MELLKTVSTQEFRINSPILYYATTTNILANATFSNVYSEYPITTLQYTANQTSWTSQLPIYLKGTILTNGNFKLDGTTATSFMTQTLPTTDDSFVYIWLGQMYSTTGLRLTQSHPMYEYKGGAIRPYTVDGKSLEFDWNGTQLGVKTESDVTYEYVDLKGTDGTDGSDGTAATISIGTTSTGNAGTNASVTNTGTSSAAIFNFTIPRGVDGADG